MVLVDLLLGLLSGMVPWGGPDSRRQRRRRAAAFAAGEEVWFHGCVIGSKLWSEGQSNLLCASPTALATAYALARRHTRRFLPTERLELVRVRPPSMTGPDQKLPRSWRVAEFRDGDTTLLIATFPSCIPYVTHLFSPPPPGPAITGPEQ